MDLVALSVFAFDMFLVTPCRVLCAVKVAK